MPNAPASEPHDDQKGLWLALSGGGLRAAIYHYGCLRRLRELGLLPRVTVVSATSGGAITAALLVAAGAAGPRATDDGWATFEARLLTAARRGLLGPAAIAVVARALYLGFSISAILSVLNSHLQALAVVLLAAAMLAHGIATIGVRRLRSEPTRARTLVAMDARYATTAASIAPVGPWARLCREASIALSPDRIREFILHHQLYEHMPLGSLDTGARLFLIAADLSSGREMVFSATALADLSPPGCKALWRQDSGSKDLRSTLATTRTGAGAGFFASYNAFDIPVSTAVAASSAFPPVFAPVQVTIGDQHVGSFIDGGVVDNQAMNVACRIARTVSSKMAHNYPAGIVADQISHVLAIDAGASPAAEGRPIRSRLWALFSRLPQILANRQQQKAMDDVADVGRLTGVPTSMLGLRAGLPPDCSFHDGAIGSLAARIRTHLDSFTPVEIATLAYLGYCWTDYWARDSLPEAYVRGAPRAASPTQLLAAQLPLPPMDDSAVAAHLTWSAHSLGLYRTYKRWRSHCRRG